jgi:hypothetical protein
LDGIVPLHAKQSIDYLDLVTWQWLNLDLFRLSQACRADPVTLLDQRPVVLCILLVSDLMAHLFGNQVAF